MSAYLGRECLQDKLSNDTEGRGTPYTARFRSEGLNTARSQTFDAPKTDPYSLIRKQSRCGHRPEQLLLR